MATSVFAASRGLVLLVRQSWTHVTPINVSMEHPVHLLPTFLISLVAVTWDTLGDSAEMTLMSVLLATTINAEMEALVLTRTVPMSVNVHRDTKGRTVQSIRMSAKFPSVSMGKYFEFVFSNIKLLHPFNLTSSGTCLDGIGNYTCLCVDGFIGKMCEIDKDECDPNPCQHGTCQDYVNSYSCTCEPGFSGTK